MMRAGGGTLSLPRFISSRVVWPVQQRYVWKAARPPRLQSITAL